MCTGSFILTLAFLGPFKKPQKTGFFAKKCKFSSKSPGVLPKFSIPLAFIVIMDCAGAKQVNWPLCFDLDLFLNF